MSPHTPQHSQAWIAFTYGSFLGAAGMVALGLLYMPFDTWMKGYLAMGIVMLVQSCANLTKTIRDVHEGKRLMNRIEDARTERLLMEAGKE